MRIGFAIDSDCNSQFMYSVFEQTKYFIGDVLFFCERKGNSLLNYNICSFPIEDSFYFTQSPLIATSINTAKSILNNHSNTKKYLYLYDLEWYQKISKFNYDHFEQIYRNKDLEIIAENEDFAKIFTRCWNRKPCAVIPKTNLNEIYRLYYGHSKSN